MKKKFDILFIVGVVLLSLLVGIAFDDLVGGITLAFGFLSAYYSAVGKWINYIFGILFSIIYAYINFINGLYGLVVFTVLVYLPVQIYGIISWIKTKDDDGVVLMSSLKAKHAVLLCASVVVFSVGMGFVLNLIPSQNLPFLDSFSQLINVAGVVLCSLRFRECWYIWLINNVVDLTIWIINVCNVTPSAIMMLITSIMYLIMNIIGLMNWVKKENEQKRDDKT